MQSRSEFRLCLPKSPQGDRLGVQALACPSSPEHPRGPEESTLKAELPADRLGVQALACPDHCSLKAKLRTRTTSGTNVLPALAQSSIEHGTKMLPVTHPKAAQSDDAAPAPGE